MSKNKSSFIMQLKMFGQLNWVVFWKVFRHTSLLVEEEHVYTQSLQCHIQLTFNTMKRTFCKTPYTENAKFFL